MTQETETGGAVLDSLANIADEKMSIMEVVNESDSWFILIPLLLMSIYAIYIFVERFMTLRKADKEEKIFMTQIKNYVQQGDLNGAKNLCTTTDSPVSRMVEKGISRIGKPMADISASIENVGKLEVSKLENNLAAIATISGLAPMIGFLGTVIGMVEVFYKLKVEGMQGNFLESLSGGIMKAMVTTVAGLIVGIMTYFFYNYLVSKISKVVQNMEAHSIDFIDILEEPGK